jgi:hypothetical protein
MCSERAVVFVDDGGWRAVARETEETDEQEERDSLDNREDWEQRRTPDLDRFCSCPGDQGRGSRVHAVTASARKTSAKSAARTRTLPMPGAVRMTERTTASVAAPPSRKTAAPLGVWSMRSTPVRSWTA